MAVSKQSQDGTAEQFYPDSGLVGYLKRNAQRRLWFYRYF
jgi:hypothetical protein